MQEIHEIQQRRTALLDQAKQVITRDRQATHGNAEDNFRDIAQGWNWWLSIRQKGPLTAFDVAIMMDLFKTVRAAVNPQHMDNFVDKVGYSAIAGEIAERIHEGLIPESDTDV